MERRIRHQQTRVAACVLTLVLGAAWNGRGQTPGEPEVRRALPVTRSEPPTAPAVPFEQPAATPAPANPELAPAIPARSPQNRTNRPSREDLNFENPAWMQFVTPTPTPAERVPDPVPPPSPQATPFRPVRSPNAVATETPALRDLPPAPPVAAPIVETTPGPDAIRIAPARQNSTNPAETLSKADGFYGRKMYDLAIPEYEMFLITARDTPGRDQALFRLAESHRILGNEVSARLNYEKLLREFESGEFIGPAAYRLGDMLFAEKKWEPALIQFRRAAKQADDSKLKLSARYFEARALEQLGRRSEAGPVYEEVAGTEGENPYRDFALLSLAESQISQGDKAQALERYLQLAEKTSKPELRVEATVKAAALANELGKREEALDLFSKVLTLPGAENWIAPARLGILRLQYDAGDYAKVLGTSPEQINALPGDLLPEGLLILANAHRQSGNHAKAREIYDRILLEFPKSTAVGDAKFQRLVSLYATGSPDIVREVDEFLLLATDGKERAQATLLKAEMLFKQEKFAEAAPLYRSLLDSPLPDSLKTEALYKLGWCYSRTAAPDQAIKTLTRFLEEHPDHPAAAAALARRALVAQESKQFEAALKDFDQIIAKYPQAPERELAMQQKALIFGQLKRNDEMQSAFRQLLEAYPKTPAAAQAWFWIGWVDFEGKKYAEAIPALQKSRELDPAQYGERASLRILLSHYYQENAREVEKEVAVYKAGNLPPEIPRWLGLKAFEAGEFVAAERHLNTLINNPGGIVTPEIYLMLGQARLGQGKAKEAEDPIGKYLESARDPISRARGLMARSQALLQQKQFEEAERLAEEALLLQPEGRYNAEARMLLGDTHMAKNEFDAASRAYMTIAVLYDDASITPKALKKAAEAYKKLGNTMEAQKALDELKKRYPESELARAS